MYINDKAFGAIKAFHKRLGLEFKSKNEDELTSRKYPDESNLAYRLMKVFGNDLVNAAELMISNGELESLSYIITSNNLEDLGLAMAAGEEKLVATIIANGTIDTIKLATNDPGAFMEAYLSSHAPPSINKVNTRIAQEVSGITLGARIRAAVQTEEPAVTDVSNEKADKTLVG